MLAVLSLVAFVLVACITPKNSPPPTNPPAVGSASCSLGQEFCGGRCMDSLDFTNDNHNCGRCGHSCSFNETCTGSFCSCAAGTETCMGSCVSTSAFLSDSQNCGRCGNVCFGGQTCIGGMCQKM